MQQHSEPLAAHVLEALGVVCHQKCLVLVAPLCAGARAGGGCRNNIEVRPCCAFAIGERGQERRQVRLRRCGPRGLVAEASNRKPACGAASRTRDPPRQGRRRRPRSRRCGAASAGLSLVVPEAEVPSRARARAWARGAGQGRPTARRSRAGPARAHTPPATSPWPRPPGPASAARVSARSCPRPRR